MALAKMLQAAMLQKCCSQRREIGGGRRREGVVSCRAAVKYREGEGRSSAVPLDSHRLRPCGRYIQW